MEKETKALLWILFVIGVLTVGYVPAAWMLGQQTTDVGVVSTNNLGHALWNSDTSTPSYVLTTMDNPPKVSIIPGATEPNIISVLFDTTSWNPKITVVGRGFGNTPSDGQVVLTVSDVSRGWTASNTSSNLAPVISSWTNDQVVVNGLSGYGGADIHNFADGLGSFVFAPGDTVTIDLTNPQTSIAGTTTVTYPLSAALPTLTLSTQSQMVETSTSTSVTAHVSFHGTPLSNQAVNFTADSGTFSGSNGTQVNGLDYMAFTDSSGNVSVNYQAGTSPQPVVISGMADAVTEHASITVVAKPEINLVQFSSETFPPKMQIAGVGFGNSPYMTNDNLVIQDVSQAWIANLTIGAVGPTVQSWTDTDIDVNGFRNYGSGDPNDWSDGHGSWSFRPGDSIRVQVRNPENNLASNWYTTTYPTNAPVPAVNVQGVGSQMVDSSLSITGTVFFQGQTLANQAVLLNSDSGSFTAGGQETAFGSYEVSTNAMGQFTAIFNTPKTATMDTVFATVDGQTANTGFEVESPTITWNKIPTLMVGQFFTASGQVTWNGQGLGSQTVVVNGQDVQTDATGRFYASFTAPDTPGIVPLTATCDGATVTNSIEVTPFYSVSLGALPTSQYAFTLTATATHSLSGQGYQAYIGILDTTTGTWVATGSTGTTVTVNVTLSDGHKHSFVAYVLGNNEEVNTALAVSPSLTANPGYYYQTSVWVNGTCSTTQSCTTQNTCTTTESCTTSYGCRPGDVVDPLGFCWNPRTGSEENPVGSTTCQPVTSCASKTACTPVTTCSKGYSNTTEAYSSPYVTSP